jgi:hypothetical protein
LKLLISKESNIEMSELGLKVRCIANSTKDKINKIKGTPSLKLAMVKRLKVKKKSLEKSKFQKIRQKNLLNKIL